MKESKRFGQLLTGGISSIAGYEGKNTAYVDDELGEEIGGLSRYTIQRYKHGSIPPKDTTKEILAKAIIKRGHLDRDWAEEFLKAAKHNYIEAFLDKLFPASISDKKHDDHICENLPAATYSKFVMRKEAYQELVRALSQRLSVLLLYSFKGMGKSSLARELAHKCIHEKNNGPKFEAAIWVDYSARGGTTNLNVVLDEISLTLNYPGLTKLPLDEKIRKVEQLLRRQKVLLIIDGAETISDSSVFEWILKLPEPSKCLVTSSNKNLKDLGNNIFSYELKGMIDEEAQEFINFKLDELNLRHLISDRSQLDPLLEVSGGNPKAIEIILGYMKHERQSLSKTLEDLTSSGGKLFDTLFSGCWGIIHSETKRVLLAMQMFPYSASADALSAVADVKRGEFNRALNSLTDLSLIDVLRSDLESPPRYELYSLVKAFVVSKNKDDEDRTESFRMRWVNWYSNLAAKIGFCWNDISKLKLLDPRGERQTIQFVINWAFKNELYDQVIQISKDVRYYFYVRGFWSRDPSINLLRAEAARRQSNFLEEFEALLYHANIASKQGNVDEVKQHLPRLEEIAKNENISDNLMCDYRHVKALYLLACDSFKEAAKLWQINLKSKLSSHAYNANRRWYAVCLYRDKKISKAKELLAEVLKDARETGFIRGEIAANLRLAWIDIDQKKFDSAQQRLNKTLGQATDDAKDQRAIADIYHCQGVIHRARGKKSQSHEMFTKAADLFERLGMERELLEVRNKFNAIED